MCGMRTTDAQFARTGDEVALELVGAGGENEHLRISAQRE